MTPRLRESLTRRQLTLLVVAIGVGALLVVAAPAAASSVTVRAAQDSFGLELVYVAAPGERNDLNLTGTTNPDSLGCCSWTVRDRGAVILAGASCASIDAHTARWVAPSPGPPFPDHVNGARVALGDLDDRLRVEASAYEPVHVFAMGGSGDDVLAGKADDANELDGGDGDDVLYGRDSTDRLFGGAGDDRLFGGRSSDELDGGGGRDELYGQGDDDLLVDGDRDGVVGDAGPGPDVLDGGSGGPDDRDEVSYRGRTARVVVDLAASRGGERSEGDTLRRVEFLVGGRGDDRLAGTDGSDGLDGGPGHDRLIGRGGDDTFTGARGAILCGRGTDTVVRVSASDYLIGCEMIFEGYDDADLFVVPNPAAVSGSLVSFRIGCPISNAIRRQVCSGTLNLRRAYGRRRLVASGAFPRGRWRGRLVATRLTPLGYRLAARGDGVLATVTLDGFHFQWPVRWRIRLRLAS